MVIRTHNQLIVNESKNNLEPLTDFTINTRKSIQTVTSEGRQTICTLTTIQTRHGVTKVDIYKTGIRVIKGDNTLSECYNV